jgi:HSP20 family protein
MTTLCTQENIQTPSACTEGCTTTHPKSASQNSYRIPTVDLYHTTDGYTVEADLPGVAKEGLEVYLDGNELTILGRRQVPTATQFQHRESGEGDFRRVFELDPEIDTDRITAKVENGVLTLHLAKRNEVKPRRIAIND